MNAAASTERALHLLQQVAATLSTGELLEGLPEAVARIAECFGFPRAAVFALSEPRAAVIHLVATSDDTHPTRLPFDLDLLPALAQALAERRPLRMPVFGPFAVTRPTHTGRSADDALLALPLVPGGIAIGCLIIEPPRDEPLADDTLRTLRTAAQIIAVALRGGHFLESLREQTSRLSLTALEARQRRGIVEQHRELFASAADAVMVLDANGVVLHCNRAAEQLTGYARLALQGRALRELVPPEQHAGLDEIVAQAAAGAHLSPFDLELHTTSGEPLRVSASNSTVLAGHDIAVLHFRDVTEARALEQELRKTKDFFERLIDAAVDGIIAADMSGRIILFNPGAERVSGWRAEEVLGVMPVWKLYPEGEARQIMTALRSAAQGGPGKLLPSYRKVMTKSGEVVPVSLAAAIIYEDGQEVATVGIFSDLRERQSMEQRLAEAQEKLVESERQAMIAELAGATAHELNQPLTSVMGYAELLHKRTEGDAANQRAAAIVLREAERMAEIVRKIGKITRYETKAYVGATSILDLDKSIVGK